jgi:hypothetical protein
MHTSCFTAKEPNTGDKVTGEREAAMAWWPVSLCSTIAPSLSTQAPPRYVTSGPRDK